MLVWGPSARSHGARLTVIPASSSLFAFTAMRLHACVSLLLLALCAPSSATASHDVFTLRVDGASAVAQSVHDEGALALRAIDARGFACNSLQGPACV